MWTVVNGYIQSHISIFEANNRKPGVTVVLRLQNWMHQSGCHAGNETETHVWPSLFTFGDCCCCCPKKVQHLNLPVFPLDTASEEKKRWSISFHFQLKTSARKIRFFSIQWWWCRSVASTPPSHRIGAKRSMHYQDGKSTNAMQLYYYAFLLNIEQCC